MDQVQLLVQQQTELFMAEVEEVVLRHRVLVTEEVVPCMAAVAGVDILVQVQAPLFSAEMVEITVLMVKFPVVAGVKISTEHLDRCGLQFFELRSSTKTY